MLFNDEVRMACEFTGTYESFREAVDDAHASGDTKLYDCLGEAANHLIRYTDALKTAQVGLQLTLMLPSITYQRWYMFRPG